MSYTLPRPKFEQFGPSRLTRLPSRRRYDVALPIDDAVARRAIRATIDDQPGIYGMVGPGDELIYVGKSKALRDRLVSYLFDTDSNQKSRRIIEHTHRIAIEPAENEFAALLRELELIRRWRPRFNVQYQPGRSMRAYLCFQEAPAPFAALVYRPPRSALACFGPFKSGRKTRAAVEHLNYYFQLRDCPVRTPMYFADQLELFSANRSAGCLRYELGNCPGPCAGFCTRADYHRNLSACLQFLSGEDLSCLDILARRMEVAAKERRFETAATTRDALESLTWLHGQMELLRGVDRQYTFIYRVPRPRGGETWYLVRRGQVTAVGPRPRTLRTAERWIARLPVGDIEDRSPVVIGERGDAITESIPTTEVPNDLEMAALVTTWFRKNPEQREQTLSIYEALRYCRAVKRSDQCATAREAFVAGA